MSDHPPKFPEPDIPMSECSGESLFLYRRFPGDQGVFLCDFPQVFGGIRGSRGACEAYGEAVVLAVRQCPLRAVGARRGHGVHVPVPPGARGRSGPGTVSGGRGCLGGAGPPPVRCRQTPATLWIQERYAVTFV
ncbi:hypothetical protein GCM10018785_08070 [Streptomyces longispororuber]|uniref:Uncharacterized protein n=1 Tax=Streptomyces longispororuber TaxID=68230 RepID=A0A919DEI4_9ACTN|nr:hypothetical protein GCM10018785_08070 [Streptomyces longispororuber]